MTEKKNRPDNMRKVLEMLEKRLAGKRVFRYMKENEIIEISAEQFFRDVRAAAARLRTRLPARSHIGIMGANSYEWLVGLCAVFWSGSTAVLLDREITADELRIRSEKTDVRGMICDGSAEQTARQAFPSGNMTILSTECIRTERNMAVQLTEAEETCRDKDKDSLACIFFTSGTTGGSKAVMVSERGLTVGICHRINDRSFRSLLAVLPFHHLSGFSSVLNALYLGAEVCIATDIKYFYRYLEAMKPDYVFVVPSMLRMLARKLKNGGPNGKLLGWDLHLINCGGATFCPEFLQMLLDRDITVLQGYGASEAGAIGFLWEMTTDRPDTIGKPPAGMEIKIVDGELYLKSEAVMMGYYGDKEETKKVLRDGWYATGDLCRMDDDGFIYLTGRRKNLIILANGENVSPEEIEKNLYQYDEICEVVVHAEGELITASVFPRYPEGASEEEREEIKDQIRKDIAVYNSLQPVYRQIMKIRFLDHPAGRTSSGKLIRSGILEEE